MNHTDEIKQRLDIVELVAEYITLKPAGSGSMKANCPFHQEKTPSFYVSREKQIWHCFGCSRGGDAFAFVMEMEGVDFPEALRQLAEKTGVEIQRFESEGANQKKRLLKLLELATKFYEKYLAESPSATVARTYLDGRGITTDLREKFRLGYAPDRWDGAVTILKKCGFRESEMVEAGLAIRRETGSGVYDRFRHRIMFPICDVRGVVIGFSARLLDETREEGKYINTPQTVVYNKSQALYGLHLGKLAMKAVGAAIIVEGNMDVIASHKAGRDGVVASSGTALTREQLSLLKRFTDTLLICFDADAAGEQAAKRGIDLALLDGFNVKVVRIDGAKDPDDLVKRDPEAWPRAVDAAVPVMDFYFEKAFRAGNPKTGIEKKKIGDLLLGEIARLSHPIERNHWLHELSVRLGTPESVLLESLAGVIKVSRESGAPRSKQTPLPPPRTRRTLLAEALLGMVFARADMRSELFDLVESDHLSERERALYLSSVSGYHEFRTSDGQNSLSEKVCFDYLRKKITSERSDLLPLFDRLVLQGEREYQSESPREIKLQAEFIVKSLADFAARDTYTAIADELREAERAGDRNRVDELAKKFNELK